MWQQYGKGKDRAQLVALHQENRTDKTDVCNTCGLTKPIGDFGIVAGRRRKTCNLCRAANEVAKNEVTLAGADRRGLEWTREEIEFLTKEKRLSDGQIAAYLKRTLGSVRSCRRRLGLGRKRGKAAKPLYSEFTWFKDSRIEGITVETEGNKISVFSPPRALWVNIHKAILAKGLTGEDYQAWKAGATAGA